MWAKLRQALFGCGLFALTACPKDVYLTTERWAPGPISLQGAETLAIAPLSGTGGSELATCIDSALQNAPRLRLVDRRHLECLVQEEALLERFGSKQGAGTLLRADVLVIGEVTENDYYEDITYETRADESFFENTVYRRTPVATVRASLKFIDSRTGWTLATRHYSSQQTGMTDFRRGESGFETDSAKLGALFAPADEAVLRQQANHDIAAQIFDDVAPHHERVQVVLEHEPSLDDSQRALDAAYRGNWERAVFIYRRLSRELDRVAPENLRFRASAHYDLGVALGAWGKHSDALHEVEYANHLAPRRLYLQTFDRLTRERDDANLLKADGHFASLLNNNL